MPLKPIKTKDRLEQLKQNPLQAVEYAWRIFDDRRWPQAEGIIIKHPRAAANLLCLIYTRDGQRLNHSSRKIKEPGSSIKICSKSM